MKIKKMLGTTMVIMLTTLFGCTGINDNSTYTMEELAKVAEELEESNGYEETVCEEVEEAYLIVEDKVDTDDIIEENNLSETLEMFAENAQRTEISEIMVDSDENCESYVDNANGSAVSEMNEIKENVESEEYSNTSSVPESDKDTSIASVVEETTDVDNQNETNTNSSSLNDDSNESTTNSSIVAPKYTCEARILNYNSIYSNSRVVVYIKTDHTDGSKISLSTNSGAFSNVIGVTYSDINYVEPDNIRSYMERVEGGYLCVIEPQNVGCYTFVINDSSSGNLVPIGSFDIVVKDRVAAENDFYQNVISSVTTSDMTNVQKMDAICMYVSNNFMYKASDVNGSKIYLTSLEGPWVANHRVNCLETTAMMMEFANRLGLQSESTYAGYANHYYATVTIDGVPYVYDACPMGETGTVSSWNYVL